VAQKQDISVRGYFGIGGGLGIPVGDFGDLAKTGWLGQAIGGFTTRGGVFGARADVSFGQNSMKLAAGKLQLVGLNTDVVLTPGHRPANFHPYFLAGVGVYNAKPISGAAGSSQTKLALNTGVGVQFHLGHRTDLYVEGRLLSIRTQASTNLIPLTVGFRWGGI
jgi:hypothetical protein